MRDESGLEAVSITTQGQTITFNESFRKVYDVMCNVVSSDSNITVQARNFTGISPSGFDVYVYDADGNFTSVDITWTARGATDL